jgi:hypothetical protein
MRKTFFLIILMLCQISLVDLYAQNVTVSPKTGKLISALTESSDEIGFQSGFSAMWRHNQLPLSFITADEGTLTSNGSLAVQACNFVVRNDKLVDVALAGSGYNILTLPKGYRFTGYKIVMKNNLEGVMLGSHKVHHTGAEWKMMETSSTFDRTNPIKSVSLGTTNSGDQEYVLERTSNDMGNILYFRMEGNYSNGNYYSYDYHTAIEYESIEVTFAPDGDFTTNVAPTTTNSAGASYVETPFATDKVDVGPISAQSKNGSTYYAYYNKNVTDLYANIAMYEEGAVSGGRYGEFGDKTIRSIYNQNDSKYYYAVKNKTYYVESPTEVKVSDNNVLPLHYRIVNANINYASGTGTIAKADYFYIQFGDYYLNTAGQFVTGTPTQWKQDANGKIYSGNNYITIQDQDTGYKLVITQNVNNAVKLYIGTNNLIYYYTNNYYYYICDENGNGEFYRQSRYRSIRANQNIPSVTLSTSKYKLTVYGKDGSTVLQTVDVDGTSGTVEIPDLNNDAVKFSISGAEGEDVNAFISVDLTMQALNPYIESMEVVCNGPNNTKLKQQFTSDDFSVGGDKFVFYVPEDFLGQNCKFTFEDLRSKYGDNTYYDGLTNGKSRYSFVMSEYYQKTMDGADNDNIYAHTDIVANYPYTGKVAVDVSGSNAFRFNNADELDKNNTSATTNTLKEYPFSVAAYKAAGFSFGNVVLPVVENSPDYTCYVFTADETRYNIAPTTATQHRYYAYYTMIVQLVPRSYTPVLTWNKIYDKTLYYDSATNTDVETPMYGLSLATTDKGVAVDGYLTTNQIMKGITAALNSTDAPAAANQILYVDASKLNTVVYESYTDGRSDGLTQLKAMLAPNALIYLPKTLTFDKDNFAYMTTSNTFKSCKNIILTDKQPFFAPYDIQVDAANYATYTRLITTPKNGEVTNATLMLPFTLNLDGKGLHSNADGKCSFIVNKMVADNCLTLANPETASYSDYAENAKFTFDTDEKTEANVPYMVKVESCSANEGDTQLSFVATQYGSNIVKSLQTADYVYPGENATGFINGGTYYFTNNSSYSGKKLDKTGNIFYFAKNMYLSSKNLKTSLPYLYVYPFRSYYTYSTTAPSAKALNGFNVSYDINDNATGINDLKQKSALLVTTGNGTMTATASENTTLKVYSAAGSVINITELKAGETRTMSIPSGIYVVNGTKIIVK